MNTDTGPKAGFEWAGGGDETPVETDSRGWPVLHANDPCDGVNPMTGRTCIRTYHQGYHQDFVGAQWLDEE